MTKANKICMCLNSYSIQYSDCWMRLRGCLIIWIVGSWWVSFERWGSICRCPMSWQRGRLCSIGFVPLCCWMRSGQSICLTARTMLAMNCDPSNKLPNFSLHPQLRYSQSVYSLSIVLVTLLLGLWFKCEWFQNCFRVMRGQRPLMIHSIGC